jgi:hypothetical protein
LTFEHKLNECDLNNQEYLEKIARTLYKCLFASECALKKFENHNQIKSHLLKNHLNKINFLVSPTKSKKNMKKMKFIYSFQCKHENCLMRFNSEIELKNHKLANHQKHTALNMISTRRKAHKVIELAK